jgi:hypothetical protein
MRASITDKYYRKAYWQRRPYWVARYLDGREVPEYDCDWSLLPRANLVQLRLYCPDGNIGVVNGDRDRLFTFGVGESRSDGRHIAQARVIGTVIDTLGNCDCCTWEWPGKYVEFKDVWRGGIERYGPISLKLDYNIIQVPH